MSKGIKSKDVKAVSPKEVKAVKPDQIASLKEEQIPNEVLAAFNALIAKNFDGKQAIVMQDEVVEAIMAEFKNNGKKMTRDKLFDNNWLDVEIIYQKEGWKVEFDQPAYCETYDAFFTFKKKSCK